MSSTSNAQNLLVNVFRPTYVYEAGVGYTPSLVVSNVDKIVSGSVVTSNLVISDSGSNTYIGSNAGNSATNVRASSNNVAIGYNAGNAFSNTSNTVAVGYNALGGSLSNVSNTVAIGANTIGGGVNNILIGHDTGTIGSNNILIGPGQTPGFVSDQLRIGNSNSIAIAADMANHLVGINNAAPVVEFDVSGQAYFRNKVGIQVEAPSKSLEVNGETYSSIGFLAGRGSVPKPAFAFYADGSTGLYSPGNGYGSFIANGAPYITFGGGTVNFHGRIVTDISGGGSTANTITLSNGLFRDTSTGSIMLDISEGNIYTIGDTFTNNLIYSGFISNTNSNTRNVIGGVVLSNGDVSANSYNGPGGTANAPHYTFSDDRRTGLFFPGSNMIGLTAGGTERVRISNANVGIGTTAPGSALDISGVARIIGPAGTITFSNGVINAPVGINLSGSPIVASNGAFSNASTTSNSIGGVTFSNGNLSTSGFGTQYIGNVSISLNSVSNVGNLAYFGAITGSTTSASNSIGGVTLSNGTITAMGSNNLGSITATSLSLLTSPPTTVSISGFAAAAGNLSISNIDFSGAIVGSTLGASNRIGGVTLSNGDLQYAGAITGLIPMASNVIGGVVLSNCNVVNARTTSSSNFIGTSTASNWIGGVTLSNFDVSLGGVGRIFGQTNVSNMIGGVTFSNFDLSMGGTGRILGLPSTSNSIGGVTLSNTNLSLAGTISGSTANTSNVIGGVVLSNNNVSNSGTHTSGNFIGTSSTSNSIGGVTLNNTNLTLAGTITGSTANTSNVIGGVVLSNNTISNSSTTTSSSFIGTSSTSNSIGGVTLNNTNLTLAGTITGSTANTSNVIGGVVLSNNNVSNSGTHTSGNFIGTSNASNWIGGVTLSNFDLSMGGVGRIFGQTNVSNMIGGVTFSNFDLSMGGTGRILGLPNTSNWIGGVTLSNNNLTLPGTITGSTANTSNVIGGVVLSNNTISNSSATSNSIGGVTLNNTNLTLAGTITGSTANTSNVIGGVTLSNNAVTASGIVQGGQLMMTNDGTYNGNMQVRGAGASQYASLSSYVRDNTARIDLTLESMNNTNSLERVRIVGSTGNVGIGTSAPGTKLEVAGTTTSTAFIGTSTTSNSIGGVTLNNTNLTLAGTITGSTANTSNVIGGVILSNSDISQSGIHTAGTFRSGSGTVSAPAHSFSANPNSGMYLAAANDLRFAIGGSDRIRFQASNAVAGSVDVSKTSLILVGYGPNPVNTDPTVTNEIVFRNYADQYTSAIRQLAASSTAFADSNRLGFFTSPGAGLGDVLVERMTIRNNGYVGINRTTPVVALDVGGDISATRINITGTGSTTSAAFGFYGQSNLGFYGANNNEVAFISSNGERLRFNQFGIYNDSNASNTLGGVVLTNNLIRTGAGTAGVPTHSFSTDTATGLFSAGVNQLGFATAGVQRMVISTSNVGINTVAPSYNLDVSGTGVIGNLVQLRNNAGAAGIRVTGNAFADTSGIQLYQNTTENGLYCPHVTFPFVFTLGSSERMRITSNGNVGIGVAAPDSQLHLSLDTAKKLTTTTWATGSDRRVKHNIERADVSLCYTTVKRLPLQRFTWDASYAQGTPDCNSVGWIAQDVKEVFPKAVSIDSNDMFPDFHSLNVDQIYKTMYGALEKVIADKEALEQRVLTLEDQLSNVLTRLSNANL